jgi:hypothetical protein
MKTQEQHNGLIELHEIIEKLDQLGHEAREIIKEHFPNSLSKGDAYGVFDMGYSTNQYDNTLYTIIEDIELTIKEEQDYDN